VIAHPDVTALILAGGKATRLGGIAKHELVIDGATIFARQVAVLAPRVAELIVSASVDRLRVVALSDALRRKAERFWPLTTRLPEVGRSIEAISLTSVDLPAPECPVIRNICPASMVKLTSLTAS